jgi:hypothetical protein
MSCREGFSICLDSQALVARPPALCSNKRSLKRSMDKFDQDELAMRTQLVAKQDERVAERRSRTDDLRLKYGLLRTENAAEPYK